MSKVYAISNIIAIFAQQQLPELQCCAVNVAISYCQQRKLNRCDCQVYKSIQTVPKPVCNNLNEESCAFVS